MQIAYAITKATWGGAQAYVAALARAARAQGHTPSLIAGTSGRLSDALQEAGISVTLLPSLERDLGVRKDITALRDLVRTLKNTRPDVLHLNSSKMGVLGALAGRIVGVPRIVFTAHGWPHREPRSFLWKTLAWVGSWVTVLLSHRVIVVSRADLRTSPALFLRSKLVLVHNGIADTPLLSRSEARAGLTEQAPLLATYEHWLLMNAELHRNKGIDIAIDALRTISDQNPTVALVVCGTGEERDNLLIQARKQGVADRVFLLGFVPGARTYLRAADIYLMPSRKEGLPIALLEAVHAQIPVIASRTGGIPEALPEQFLIPIDNAGALADRITAFLTQPIPPLPGLPYTEDQMITGTFAVY